MVRDSFDLPLVLCSIGSYDDRRMGQTTDISRPIIEALYCEALVLADEVRQVFDLNPVHDTGEKADQVRMAISVEGLRTTTRVMHVLAWLLNQRAYFDGDLSEFQLRRHSKLPPDRASEAANMQFLEEPTRGLIYETEQLHARISRLDTAWRDGFEMRPAAIRRLQERLGHAVSRA